MSTEKHIFFMTHQLRIYPVKDVEAENQSEGGYTPALDAIHLTVMPCTLRVITYRSFEWNGKSKSFDLLFSRGHSKKRCLLKNIHIVFYSIYKITESLIIMQLLVEDIVLIKQGYV